MINDGFENPWEQIRLLSDERRTMAFVELLRRHARGKRVLEVGCGTGLLSCVAAQLGAKQVIAVEAMDIVDVAQEIVRDHGLDEVVTVIQADVADLPRGQVDLVFGELFNANPFFEQIVETMGEASLWLTPEGILAPWNLRLWVALVENPGPSAEAQKANAIVERLCGEFDLMPGPFNEFLFPEGVMPPDEHLEPLVKPISKPALALDLDLREAWKEELPGGVYVSTTPLIDGFAGGATVWFEAELDDGLVVSNEPGRPGHFGHLVSGWAEPLEIRAGEDQRLRLGIDEHDDVSVIPWGHHDAG